MKSFKVMTLRSLSESSDIIQCSKHSKILIRSVKIPVLMIGLLCFLQACTFTSTYVNRAKDVSEASNLSNNFYTSLKNKDYDKAVLLLNSKSSSIESEMLQMKASFKQSDSLYGPIESLKLLSCSTKVIEGTKTQGTYSVVYHINRQKAEMTEKLELLNNDSYISIIGLSRTLK